MATIGKIRKHSTLLLIAVGGALVLFVLSDFLLTGGGGRRVIQDEIAIISGKKIGAYEFYQRLDEQTEMYKMQHGENLSLQMAFQIKEEVFNELIRQTILQAQYKKNGLFVSLPEMEDMMTGLNIHPIIRQNFVDPETGIFKPEYVVNYLQQLSSMEIEQQKQWHTLEKIIKEERYFEKYQTLIKNSYFFPKSIASSMHQRQNLTATAKIVSLKYASIPDEDISLNDKDFKNWYEQNKYKYEEQNETRWLEYVIFDVFPDENDIKIGLDTIFSIYKKFAEIPYENTAENFFFSMLKSDIDFNPDTNFIKRYLLPAEADSLFDMTVGSIIGPYPEHYSYYIMKLLDKKERADSLNAKHILIAYRGAFRVEPSVTRSKEEAQSLADSLLSVVRNADSLTFAQIAVEHSDDKSAEKNGGELGWFEDGNMVHAFNEACQTAKVGDYFIVDSPFGYHIVKLTGKTAFEIKVKVAKLKYTIEASANVKQKIFVEASKFASENKTIEAFNKTASDNAYVIRTHEFTRTSDYSLPGIKEAREIIRWSFNEDVKTGTVSEVFELPDDKKNVVVLVRKVRNKGIPPLEQIKDIIEPQIIKEKKRALLHEKMKQAKQNSKTINDIAKKLNLETEEFDYINFRSPNLPKVGREPKVVGTIFATEKGKISPVINGEHAVYVVSPVDITQTEQTDDHSVSLFTEYQKGFFKNKVTGEVYNALLKKANVKDNKTHFY